MQALVHRIYQMDPTAIWTGSLGASDTQAEQITIGLYQGSSQAGRSIDTIMLLNNNLDRFLVEWCADYNPGSGGAAGTGTWQALAGVSGNEGADYILFLGAPIQANGLRLTMYATQNAAGTGANQQKQLGNFIASQSLFQLSGAPTAFKPKPTINRRDIVLADGSIDTTYFFWSDNSCVLWEFDPEFNFENATDKANFETLLAMTTPFLYYPEPGEVPRNIYLCEAKTGAYAPDYANSFRGAGYKFGFGLKQVGYF
jgi:hypothetical protein